MYSVPIDDDDVGHGQYKYMLIGIPLALCADTIVETGVRRGSSTRILLSAANILDAEVYSFDHDDYPETREMIAEGEYRDDLWQFVVQDSVEAGEKWNNGSVDFLFLDTDHQQDHVYAELEAWTPHLDPQGVIVTDDAAECEEFAHRGEPLEAFEAFADEHTGWYAVYLQQDRGKALLLKS